MQAKFGLLLVAAIILAACSRPKDKVIPTNPDKWSELSEVTKDLNSDEKQLLAAYLMRNTIGNLFSSEKGSIPPGTTVGEAIDLQRDFEAKEKLKEAQAEALKARAKAERDAAIEKMNHLITFAVVSKGLSPKNFYAGQYSNRIDFVFAIKNNTAKAIAGVKGAVQFRDMFDTTIENIGISVDQTIPANSEKTISGYGKDINEFKDDDSKLAVTDLAKMKVSFSPQMIVFADGSRATAPDESD